MAIKFLDNLNNVLWELFGDKLSKGDTPDDEIPSKGEVRTIIIPEEVAEPDIDQFIEVSGRYRISKLHVTPASAIIDFSTWGKKGTTVLPVYDTFSFNEVSIIEANADQLKTWVIIGSFNAVPSIISSPPAFLNITGTVLTGYANLNRLVFELVMIDAVPEVNLVITQWAGANADPSPPASVDPNLVFGLDFQDDITNIVSNPSLNVQSAFPAEWTAVVENPADLVSVDLGGSKAIRTGNNATGSLRAWIRLVGTSAGFARLSTQFTYIVKVRLPVEGTSTASIGIGGNSESTVGLEGFLATLLSTGVRARLGSLNFGPTTALPPLAHAGPKTGEFAWVAISYGDVAGTDFLDIYYKSTEAAIAFANVFSNSDPAAQDLTIFAELDYQLGKQGTSTTYSSMEWAAVQMYNTKKTALEIEALMVD